jgi:hypothetical protein
MPSCLRYGRLGRAYTAGVNAERFWTLIDAARGGGDPHLPSAPPGTMAEVLEGLSDAEVIAFGTAFTDEVCRLNDWRVWGAGNAIFEDMSGDGFHYFRSWLVGKGRFVAELALREPDALGSYVDDPEVDNESLEYAALDVLKRRGLDIDPRDAAGDADASPVGEPYGDDPVAEYPNLMARFGAIRGRYWAEDI